LYNVLVVKAKFIIGETPRNFSKILS
jgi:hypothetical protein